MYIKGGKVNVRRMKCQSSREHHKPLHQTSNENDLISIASM